MWNWAERLETEREISRVGSRGERREDFLSCTSNRINPKALGKSVETAELLMKGNASY